VSTSRPYLVTTGLLPQYDGTGSLNPSAERVVVPSIEAARAMTRDVVGNDLHLREQASAVPESGGTVGPLPDDTMVAIRQTDWIELAGLLGWKLDAGVRSWLEEPDATTRAEIVADFNAPSGRPDLHFGTTELTMGDTWALNRYEGAIEGFGVQMTDGACMVLLAGEGDPEGGLWVRADNLVRTGRRLDTSGRA
jgi:hypothetical protein